MASCLEYSNQKLSKSDNWFSSYSQKCWGCFFGTQCSYKWPYRGNSAKVTNDH